MNFKVNDYRSAKKFVEQNSSAILISKEYKRQKDKLNFICECGEFFSTSMDAFIRKNVRQCNKCGYKNGAKKNARTHDEFIKIAESVLGSDFIITDGEYKNQKSVFTIFHKKCEKEFKRTASKILTSNNECGVCGSNIKRRLEDVQNEINSFSDEIEVVDYFGTDDVVVKHIVCETTVSRPMTELRKHRGFHCPKCKSSYGSRTIEKYLSEHKIDYIKEHVFPKCKNIKMLPFDFYLPDFNMCIEFDGEHHDRALHHWGGEEKFNRVQTNDNIKNVFCDENNIHLLRIKYKDQDKIEEILNSYINMTIPR